MSNALSGIVLILASIFMLTVVPAPFNSFVLLFLIIGVLFLTLGASGKTMPFQRIEFESDSGFVPRTLTGPLKPCVKCGSHIPMAAETCYKCGSSQTL